MVGNYIENDFAFLNLLSSFAGLWQFLEPYAWISSHLANLLIRLNIFFLPTFMSLEQQHQWAEIREEFQQNDSHSVIFRGNSFFQFLIKIGWLWFDLILRAYVIFTQTECV